MRCGFRRKTCTPPCVSSALWRRTISHDCGSWLPGNAAGRRSCVSTRSSTGIGREFSAPRPVKIPRARPRVNSRNNCSQPSWRQDLLRPSGLSAPASGARGAVRVAAAARAAAARALRSFRIDGEPAWGIRLDIQCRRFMATVCRVGGRQIPVNPKRNIQSFASHFLWIYTARFGSFSFTQTLVNEDSRWMTTAKRR